MTGSSPLARGLLAPRVRARRLGRIIPARAGFTTAARGQASRAADHPRSRGVYIEDNARINSIVGSSPLARGLPPGRGSPARPDRIIPARAGFTWPDQRAAHRRRDHPRSRGVYSYPWSLAAQYGGSSPLARGLPSTSASAARRTGIIPARAGFTRPATPATGAGRDHPRSRGVYPGRSRSPACAPGSSPLARGLRRCGHGVAGRLGIIPARAGFTRSGRRRRAARRDHPRSRGVYASKVLNLFPDWGSSPLARGLRAAAPRPTCSTGIIPARAGFTRRAATPSPPCWDHPRSRGVYICPGVRWIVPSGSSPLARGLLRPGHSEGNPLRIIPARAGFTWTRSPRGSVEPDHPRSRGVYASRCCGTGEPSGSSPLARGLLTSQEVAAAVGGIIPARAGFTRPRLQRHLRRRDHPRSRGVYVLLAVADHALGGSSPLARGLRPHGADDVHETGIIPARAGFTGTRLWTRSVPPDHPRSRGVYGPRPIS